MIHARVARTFSNEGNFEFADKKYGDALGILRKSGQSEKLRLWYLQRTHQCTDEKFAEAIDWYTKKTQAFLDE